MPRENQEREGEKVRLTFAFLSLHPLPLLFSLFLLPSGQQVAVTEVYPTEFFVVEAGECTDTSTHLSGRLKKERETKIPFGRLPFCSLSVPSSKRKKEILNTGSSGDECEEDEGKKGREDIQFTAKRT